MISRFLEVGTPISFSTLITDNGELDKTEDGPTHQHTNTPVDTIII